MFVESKRGDTAKKVAKFKREEWVRMPPGAILWRRCGCGGTFACRNFVCETRGNVTTEKKRRERKGEKEREREMG